MDKLILACLTWLILAAPIRAANQTGYFWHVTDFHYDPTYWTTQLSCNEKVSNAGQFGDYWCDSPWLLVQDTIYNMAALRRDVDFILWTGDSVAHIKDSELSLQANLEILQNITTALDDSFRDVPVYASLGNHDFYPSDQATDTPSDIYGNVSRMWEQWIVNQSQVEQLSEGGYYMARLAPKLRLLALNTNLYYTSNKLTGNLDDPAGQMAWMASQLNESRSNGEKVIVSGHVPPGLDTPGLADWFYARHKGPFVSLLLEYSDVIVATHFGHDHSDGFKILQNKEGTQAVTQFTAPSVTPWRYKIPTTTGDPHNPGVRLVRYNSTTGQHFDYVQYYINLTDSNKQNQTKWEKLYSFQEEYKVTSMSVAALREIFSQMGSTKGDEFPNKYCTNSLVSNYAINCTDDKRSEIYCGGLNYDLKEAQDCKTKYLKDLHGSASLNGLSSYIFVAAILWQVSATLLQ
jgi:sphingomyelin phosphodiesterase acid-like 3